MLGMGLGSPLSTRPVRAPTTGEVTPPGTEGPGRGAGVEELAPPQAPSVRIRAVKIGGRGTLHGGPQGAAGIG